MSFRVAGCSRRYAHCQGVAPPLYSQCEGVPDTGTSRTIVHQSVLRQAGISHDSRGKEPILAANGSSLNCQGNVLLDVCVNGVSMVVDALVSDNLHANMLVSWRDLQRLGIISQNFPALAHQVQSAAAAHFVASSPADTFEGILAEFADVFDETFVSPMLGDPMVVHLRRNDPSYRAVRVSAPRRVPLHFQDEAAKDLQWFLKSGVIVRVPDNERTEWCSPGFFVPKPNGKVRLVVDYRAINLFIERPVHPFPSPRDVVRGILPSSKWFMKLDAVQGYYQVPLDEESSRLTTFLLPEGRFRFTRAPMGMNSSSDGFCSKTDEIFSSVPKVQKIVDDALLQADTEEELFANFRLACVAARAANLTLSRPKLVYGNRIEYAGYIISDKGVCPDPKRLAAVADFPRPTDLTSLRGFLGLVNQLGFFIPDLAHMTDVLRQQLKKNVAWCWGQEHEDSFVMTKSALVSDLVVKPFDRTLRTELLTDASRLKGLGYALIQWDLAGKLRLIQCSSRSLSMAETRYATIELECLAIQWAIEDSRYYLLGCDFKVLTDHRPLVGTFEKPLTDIVNNRLLRIRLKLTDYRFLVEWTPGKTHFIADALSRAPVFEPDLVTVLARTVLAQAVLVDPALQSIYAAAKEDPAYCQVLKAVLEGVEVKNLPPAHPGRLFKGVWGQLSTRDETVVVLDDCRILIPRLCRPEILRKMHISHPGIVRTLQLARLHYFWPGITNDVKMLVDRCELCQVTRASKPQPSPKSYPEAEYPLHFVSMDLYALAGKDFLVMCDRFSGMTWVHQLQQLNTAAVLRPLQNWFNQIGYPDNILSDGGPQFRSEFQNWCIEKCIRHAPSSPYHPASNGLAENAVKSTKSLLRKSNNFIDFQSRHLEWQNVPSAGVSFSPAERFFGRRQKTCLPVLKSSTDSETFSAIPRFSVGDRVRLQNPISGLWDLKGTVIHVRATGCSFEVERDDGGRVVRNARFLKLLPVAMPQPQLLPGAPLAPRVEHFAPVAPSTLPRRSPRFSAHTLFANAQDGVDSVHSEGRGREDRARGGGLQSWRVPRRGDPRRDGGGVGRHMPLHVLTGGVGVGLPSQVLLAAPPGEEARVAGVRLPPAAASAAVPGHGPPAVGGSHATPLPVPPAAAAAAVHGAAAVRDAAAGKVRAARGEPEALHGRWTRGRRGGSPSPCPSRASRGAVKIRQA